MSDQHSTKETFRSKKKFGHKNRNNNDRPRNNSFDANTKKPFREAVRCAKCGELIADITSALSDKQTGEPVHFDCVLRFLQNAEQISEHEKVTYIGQGRFGVLYFENIHDLRTFTIKRIIEWEERDKKSDWRTKISDSHSKVT